VLVIAVIASLALAGIAEAISVAAFLLAGIAALIFFAALIALVVQLVRRRSVRAWAITAGGSLVVTLVFFVLLGIYAPEGGVQGEATQAEKRPTEETVEEGQQQEEEQQQEQQQPAEQQQYQQQQEEEPTIPGLRPADVSGHLERRGFDCVGPESLEPDLRWTCTLQEGLNEQTVEIFGPDDSSVTSVEARALTSDANETPDVAHELFGHVATIPYEGAQPRKAQAWAQDHVGSTRNASLTVGGVKFKIHANRGPGPEFDELMEIFPAGG
jgi:flagellar motor protein MotB